MVSRLGRPHRGGPTFGERLKTQDKRQKAEDRRQKTEGRGQRAEDRGQKTEGGPAETRRVSENGRINFFWGCFFSCRAGGKAYNSAVIN